MNAKSWPGKQSEVVPVHCHEKNDMFKLTASSKFGTYCLCEQRRLRRACASAQSRQNLCFSLIQAVNREEPSDRKPDPWPLWMAGHAQLKFVMTECSKTQIRLTGLVCLPVLNSAFIFVKLTDHSSSFTCTSSWSCMIFSSSSTMLWCWVRRQRVIYPTICMISSTS